MICLHHNEKLNFKPKINANIFKNLFSNLADDLLEKLHNPKHKYNLDLVQGLEKNLISFICVDAGIKLLKKLKSIPLQLVLME